MATKPTPVNETGRNVVATVAVSTKDAELDEDLTQLHDLLERVDMKGARILIQQLADKWPESERVQHLARVLAPPVVTTRPGRPGHSRQKERAWLEDHRHEYVGCWLALLGEQLIIADPDLAVVLARLDVVPNGQDALLHFEPGALE